MPSLPTLFYDDREKTPWTVKNFTMQRRRLEYGDYTIKGMEDILRIERKGSWAEIASNLSTAKGRHNLGLCVMRLSEVKGIKAILVEDNPVSMPSMAQFAEYTGHAEVRKFLHTCLIEYAVPVIPIGKGSLAAQFVDEFFTRVLAAHRKGLTFHKKGGFQYEP